LDGKGKVSVGKTVCPKFWQRSFFRLLAGDHFVPTFGRRPFLLQQKNMIPNYLRSLSTLVALNILCSFTEDLFCAFCRGVRA